MAIRRPLRRVGTDLQACTDDDMIRLRYNLRRAYAKMVHGGDPNNVGWPVGQLATISNVGTTGTNIGSATDNYKSIQYNQGTGQWHYWPNPGGPSGYGPGSDYPSAPGPGTTSTTVTLYQDQTWQLSSGDSDYPIGPGSSDLEHSYLVYDSNSGSITMETNENNIYDTILNDCISEMHGNAVSGSSVGDGIGTYWMSDGLPSNSYGYYAVADGTVMIDRVYMSLSGSSTFYNYATHKLYMKSTHNYSGNNANDGDGPGTEYHLLKEDNGQIVHNPIGEDSDLVNKVLLRYLVRNLECEYVLTSNSTFPTGYSNRGEATDHYYADSSTTYEGPGQHGIHEAYRTYSTPSGNVSAYTTYYLKLFRGV